MAITTNDILHATLLVLFGTGWWWWMVSFPADPSPRTTPWQPPSTIPPPPFPSLPSPQVQPLQTSSRSASATTNTTITHPQLRIDWMRASECDETVPCLQGTLKADLLNGSAQGIHDRELEIMIHQHSGTPRLQPLTFSFEFMGVVLRSFTANVEGDASPNGVASGAFSVHVPVVAHPYKVPFRYSASCNATAGCHVVTSPFNHLRTNATLTMWRELAEGFITAGFPVPSEVDAQLLASGVLGAVLTLPSPLRVVHLGRPSVSMAVLLELCLQQIPWHTHLHIISSSDSDREAIRRTLATTARDMGWVYATEAARPSVEEKQVHTAAPVVPVACVVVDDLAEGEEEGSTFSLEYARKRVVNGGIVYIRRGRVSPPARRLVASFLAAGGFEHGPTQENERDVVLIRHRTSLSPFGVSVSVPDSGAQRVRVPLPVGLSGILLPTSAAVIIPCFNCEDTIRETLDSIFTSLDTFAENARQLGRTISAEVIVADDHSTHPETTSVLSEYATRDSRMRVVVPATHDGAGAARNHAIRNTTADLLIFCDADDRFKANHITNIFRALEELPECGVVRTGLFINEDILEEWKNVIARTIPSNQAVRRVVNHIAGGWFKGMSRTEDVLYELVCRQIANTCFVDEPSVEFIRRPGNSLDRQMEKFRHPVSERAQFEHDDVSELEYHHVRILQRARQRYSLVATQLRRSSELEFERFWR